MSDKAFVVKNDLVANGGLLTANVAANGVGIKTTSPAYSLDVSHATDAIAVPVGNTGQRPSSANGLIRYNTDTGSFEFINTGGVTQLNQPAGSNSQVEFNDGGMANGSAGLTFSKTTNVLSVGNSVSVGNSTVNAVINSTQVTFGVVTVNTSSTFIGNSTANAFSNASLDIVANSTSQTVITPAWVSVGGSTVNVTINTAQVSVGSNVVANTSALYVGNSTINVIVNSTAVNVGTGVLINTVAVFIGNSTINVTSNSSVVLLSGNLTLNSTTFEVGTSTTNSSLNATALAVSNSTAVTTVQAGKVSVGSNVVLNTTSLTIGNSTVNVTINSTTNFGSTVNPGGGNTQVQFNDSGGFGGSAGLVFDKTANNLTVANTASALTFTSGNTTVNSTVISVGTGNINAVVNGSSLTVGNSTVNSVLNSVMLSTRSVVPSIPGGHVNKQRNPGCDIAQRGTSGVVPPGTNWSPTIDGWTLSTSDTVISKAGLTAVENVSAGHIQHQISFGGPVGSQSDLIVLSIYSSGNASMPTVATIADGLNTWTKAASVTNATSTQNMELWYSANSSPPTTINVNFSGGVNFSSIRAARAAGVLGASSLDTTITAAGNSTVPGMIMTGLVSSNNEVAFGTFAFGAGARTITEAAGFTSLENISDANGTSGLAGMNFANGGGNGPTYHPSVTGSNGAWLAIGVVFIGSANGVINWSQVYDGNFGGNALRLQSNANDLVSVLKIVDNIESISAAELLAPNASAQPVTAQWTIFNASGQTITPTLTTNFPTTRDGFGATSADLGTSTLQSIANGAFGTLAYTFVPNTAMANGYQLVLNLGTALQYANSTQYVDVSLKDFRATPGVANGQNSFPPPPEVRHPSVEMDICKRYFRSSSGNGITPGSDLHTNLGILEAIPAPVNNTTFVAIRFDVPMRTAPVMSYWDATGNSNRVSGSNTTAYINAISGNTIAGIASSNTGAVFRCTAATFNTQSQNFLQYTANAEF